jgi:hypothetical protein
LPSSEFLLFQTVDRLFPKKANGSQTRAFSDSQMHPLVHAPDVQIATAQQIMQSFVCKYDGTFGSFVESWTDANGSRIHSGASSRPLLLGPLQTAFSTFLGYCRAGGRDIEKRGAIFGLYLLASTQFAQYPAPVLLSPMEMRTVADFCREDLECASMVAGLLNRGLIAFSAVPTATRTRSAERPPAAVVTGKIVARARFETARELEERRRALPGGLDIQPELADYHTLMDAIRGDSEAQAREHGMTSHSGVCP